MTEERAMNEVPMKMYWIGEDIETFPRDRLIEVIRHLGRDLESARNTTQTIINMNETFRRAKDRYQC